MTSIAAQRPNPPVALTLLLPVLVAGMALLALALAALIAKAGPTVSDPDSAARPALQSPAPSTAGPTPPVETVAVTPAPSVTAPAPRRAEAPAASRPPRAARADLARRRSVPSPRTEPAQDPLLDDAAAAGMTSRARPPEDRP